MSERNKVILVDTNDNDIGVEDKLLAHKKPILHRAFSIMLYKRNNGQLEFLLQKRASGKYHAGGLWTNTCCSHPQPNQDLFESAKLRLLEELEDISLHNINLLAIGNFIYQAEFSNGLYEHEYDHVLISEYNDTPEFYNKEEIDELQWFGIDQIEVIYNNCKSDFTPWFYKVYTICKNVLS